MSFEAAIALFGIAFTAWAAVVGISARRFLAKMDRIEEKTVEIRVHFDRHQIGVERRLTRVETLLTGKPTGYIYPEIPESD